MTIFCAIGCKTSTFPQNNPPLTAPLLPLDALLSLPVPLAPVLFTTPPFFPILRLKVSARLHESCRFGQVRLKVVRSRQRRRRERERERETTKETVI